MTMPAPSRSFAAALRNNLPTRAADFLAFAVIAFTLRFFADLSLTVTAVITGITIPASVLAFAAGEYLLARCASRAPADGDGTVSGDGS